MEIHSFLTCCLLSAVVATTAVQKPNRIDVVAFWFLTDDAAYTGITCEATWRLVLDEINKRSDILPDHEVRLIVEDEIARGNSTAVSRLLSRYIRFRDLPENNNLGPIAILPSYSTGCKYASTVLHHVNIVGISTSCSTPEISGRRDRYPNLYRIRIPGELAIYARIKWIEEVGKFRRMALLTNADSSRDYTMAIQFYREAVGRKIDFAFFEAYRRPVNDKLLSELKQSDARIFFIDSSSPSFFMDFLCQVRLINITGEENGKYLFLAHIDAFLDPTWPNQVLPSGCTFATIIKLYKYTIFIGMTLEAGENKGNTSIGFDLTQYEKRIDIATNYSRNYEYTNRHTCYDALLQAVLTLNASQEPLKLQNLTLSDFKKLPGKVMRIINRTASEIDYINLRYGRVKYSHRLEMDYQPMSIGYYSPGTGWQEIWKVAISNSNRSKIFDVDSYAIHQVRSFNWPTRKNQPVKDVSGHVKIKYQPAVIHFGIGLGIAILLASCHLLLLIHITIARKNAGNFSLTKSFMLLSCMAMDASVIPFYWQQMGAINTCESQVVLGTLGVTLNHLLIMFRLSFSHSGLGHFQRFQSGLAINESKLKEKACISATIFFMIPFLSLISIWLGKNESFSEYKETLNIVYDQMEDTFFVAEALVCMLKFSDPLFITIWALNVLSLLNSGIVVYKIRHFSSQHHIKHGLDTQRFCFTALASCSFYLVVSLVIYALSSPTIRAIAFNYSLLIYSFQISLMAIVPVGLDGREGEILRKIFRTTIPMNTRMAYYEDKSAGGRVKTISNNNLQSFHR